MMQPTTQQAAALKTLVIPMADDEWMIGHRGSEWLALAPDLEEDLAMSSISQDEMGHAELLYEVLHGLGEASADEAVYVRGPQGWRHAALTAAARGSWAEWVVRRYCYEVFDGIRRKALQRIPYAPLVAALQKMDREHAYHLTHFQSLVQTLAYGGPASRQYLEEAIREDWPKLPDLFEWGGRDEAWVSWDVAALAPSMMRAAFEQVVRQDFAAWQLTWPGNLPAADRAARHHDNSEFLAALLLEMREVRQVAPTSGW